DRRKAAIIQAVAADVIWPYREQLARDLFRRAFETAVTHSQETQNDKGQQASQSDRAPRTDVRIEVLKLINKRDPKMGGEYNEKFSEAKVRETQERTLRNPGSGQRLGSGAHNFFGSNVPAVEGLMSIANALLNEDSKMAADVARRAVGLGVSS